MESLIARKLSTTGSPHCQSCCAAGLWDALGKKGCSRFAFVCALTAASWVSRLLDVVVQQGLRVDVRVIWLQLFWLLLVGCFITSSYHLLLLYVEGQFTGWSQVEDIIKGCRKVKCDHPACVKEHHSLQEPGYLRGWSAIWLPFSVEVFHDD